MWLLTARSGGIVTQSKHLVSIYYRKRPTITKRCSINFLLEARVQRLHHTFHNPGAPERLQELGHSSKVYPRLPSAPNVITCREYNESLGQATSGSRQDGSERCILRGRINAVRKAGSRLVFIDIIQDGAQTQALCNFRHLDDSTTTLADFRECFAKLRRGDHVQLEGFPSRSDSGEPTLALVNLPVLLSPCLPDLPTKLEDPERRIRLRHLDLLVNRRTNSMLRLKSEVVQYIRTFLLQNGHLEVQTPVLAANSGGAIARPFDTVASEFLERKISLRIAPELWLKRLLIGGFDKIFEIGPSFRNEGVDLSHNPEFTTCEFYTAFANLEDLMQMTENMLYGLSSRVQEVASGLLDLSPPPASIFSGPYRRIDFVPHVEAALGQSLPELNDPDASAKLATILKDAGIEKPTHGSLPQLLDRLSTHFIEPDCVEPTFVIHHPECLSPLAKSFKHPKTGQMVAARAELFVNGLELINTYEEENSPLEQRRKFEDQALFKANLDDTSIDESYLEALEWGLPPTGGWGGGIERLCMAMSGSGRIGDMLSFGTLRNVVALGHGGNARY